jgi:F-type H+-transporting ATPase subunit epsilon
MSGLTVEILTPEASLWSGEAQAVIARSSDGDFTVMAHHATLVGDIVPSLVRVQTTEGEVAVAVHGGFYQVGPDDAGGTRATVLAGIAELVGLIDASRAEAARAESEAFLSGPGARDDADPDQVTAARDRLARAELRLATLGASAR